jgi:hypothetical protein
MRNTIIFFIFFVQETLAVELEDLEVTATLGVGGFGRVELVQVG